MGKKAHPLIKSAAVAAAGIWGNRPLRGFATRGEANTPSGMRLSQSDQVG